MEVRQDHHRFASISRLDESFGLVFLCSRLRHEWRLGMRLWRLRWRAEEASFLPRHFFLPFNNVANFGSFLPLEERLQHSSSPITTRHTHHDDTIRDVLGARISIRVSRRHSEVQQKIRPIRSGSLLSASGVPICHLPSAMSAAGRSRDRFRALSSLPHTTHHFPIHHLPSQHSQHARQPSAAFTFA